MVGAGWAGAGRARRRPRARGRRRRAGDRAAAGNDAGIPRPGDGAGADRRRLVRGCRRSVGAGRARPAGGEEARSGARDRIRAHRGRCRATPARAWSRGHARVAPRRAAASPPRRRTTGGAAGGDRTACDCRPRHAARGIANRPRGGACRRARLAPGHRRGSPAHRSAVALAELERPTPLLAGGPPRVGSRSSPHAAEHRRRDRRRDRDRPADRRRRRSGRGARGRRRRRGHAVDFRRHHHPPRRRAGGGHRNDVGPARVGLVAALVVVARRGLRLAAPERCRRPDRRRGAAARRAWRCRARRPLLGLDPAGRVVGEHGHPGDSPAVRRGGRGARDDRVDDGHVETEPGVPLRARSDVAGAGGVRGGCASTARGAARRDARVRRGRRRRA